MSQPPPVPPGQPWPQTGEGQAPPPAQPWPQPAPGRQAPGQQASGPRPSGPHAAHGPQPTMPPPGQAPPPYGQPGPWPAPPQTAPGVQVVRIVAHAVPILLVLVGLTIPERGDMLWIASTAWSLFALAAVVVQALPVVVPDARLASSPLRTVGLAGTAAYALYWVVIALPGIDSNVGFLLTLAAGGVVGAAWLGHRAATRA